MSTLNTAEQSLPQQLAELWASLEPAARPTCLSCGTTFLLAGGLGVPSMVCPKCGFVPGDACCEYAITTMRQRHAEAEQAVVPSVESEPSTEGRCDPPGLDAVIGNAAAVNQLRTALDAHRARMAQVDGRTTEAKAIVFPHICLTGPGGVGKTTLAEIIAREVNRPIRLQMGQSMNNPSRVIDVLLTLRAGDVLFIDEVAGMKGAAQEALYRAMEDGVVVPISRAGKPVSPPIKLPPFTLIGATTDEWSLLPSLLQRFKYRIRLDRLSAADLAHAIAQRAERKGWKLTAEAAGMIADRAHGTPRLAIGLLDGCMDTAIAGGDSEVDAMIVKATCEIWRLDEAGLDKVERRYLEILRDANGPVRLNVIASQLDNLSRRTVEIKIEPTLIWLGFITKEPTGRTLTAAGREHLRKGQ